MNFSPLQAMRLLLTTESLFQSHQAILNSPRLLNHYFLQCTSLLPFPSLPHTQLTAALHRLKQSTLYTVALLIFQFKKNDLCFEAFFFFAQIHLVQAPYKPTPFLLLRFSLVPHSHFSRPITTLLLCPYHYSLSVSMEPSVDNPISLNFPFPKVYSQQCTVS